MGSSILPIIVCVLTATLLPALHARSCESYRDFNGRYHESQQCFTQYCCGTCQNRYCCSDKKYRLSDTGCSDGSGHEEKSKLATLLGSILGSVLPVLLCVGLIICCVAPCCLCYKKCRKGRNQRSPALHTTTVINTPLHPIAPGGHQPSHPGYQPVPPQPFYGGLHDPAAPPPYMESPHPVLPPAPFTPGQPLYPYPSQLYSAPPHSSELEQPPYNPSYDPKT